MSEEVILDITTVEETVTIDTTAPDVVQINVLAVTGGATTWNEIEDKPTEFPPSPHTHGNISNGGAIGSTADLVAVTGSGGVLTTASRSGIDSRTEFPPAAHTQGWDTLTGTTEVVPFTTTNGGPQNFGELAWLASTESLALRLANGENLDVGEENVYHVENNTGSTIAKGAAVSYAGTVGGSGKVRVKLWNGSTDAPEAFMGIAMGDITNGAAGYVTAFGQVRGVNTSAFSDGVILYANPSGTGLTATKPSATHVIACLCVRAANNGTLLVRPVVSEVATWDSVTGKPTEFPPSPHTHGNISNGGAIGTTADLAVVTGTSGVLTTASRSGIDSRTSFPNADVSAATSLPTANTLVRRDSGGSVSAYNIEASGYITTGGTNGGFTASGSSSPIQTLEASSPIQTFDPTSNIISRGSFVLNGGTNAITISGTPTANRAITVPDASGTLALISTAGQNFLNSPTSANFATLLTDENGTGGGFVRAEGATLTSPTISGTPILDSGVAPVMRASLQLGDMSTLGSIADVSITGAITLTSTAFGQMHVCSGTAADYTVTLPSPSGNAGRMIGFRMSNALTRFVTLSTPTGFIDGVATRIMWAQETAILYCDGANWTKISGKSRPLFASGENGAGVTVTHNTATTVSIPTTLRDNSGRMADTVTGSNVIRIRRSNEYQISAMTSYERTGSFGGFEAYALLFLNGLTSYMTSPAGLAVTGTTVSGSFTYAHVMATVTRRLSANDFIALGAFQTTGGNMTTRTVNLVRPNLNIIEIPEW